jgi:anti-sigma factor ChrR (cupin superfamily)
MTESINGDLSLRAHADTHEMDWVASPSKTVARKRLHLVGEPESGQVTSVVRYEEAASFPEHPHPGGEEILVLDGVFSDEHGDWPAGTYLLNPEGFVHAPYSKLGCELFVKLRQYPGTSRRHEAIDTDGLDWVPSRIDGVDYKVLYSEPDFPDSMRLERWLPGADLGGTIYPQGAELFVLSGSFDDDDAHYETGAWLRLPAGARHHPRTREGCELYVKLAHLPDLESRESRQSIEGSQA